MKKIMVVSVGRWVKLFLLLILFGSIVAGAANKMQSDRDDQVVAVSGELEAVQQGSDDTRTWFAQLLDKVNDQHLQWTMAQGWGIMAQEVHYSENFVENMFLRGIEAFLGFDPTNPVDQLEQGLAVLAMQDGQVAVQARPVQEFVEENEDYYVDTSAQLNNWNFEMAKLSEIALSEDNLVLLYHTHNAETYKPTDGVSKLTGENGGVSKAADVLKTSLENKYGIKTLHCKILHDYPDWNRSYINSLKSVQSLLSSNKSIQAVFDVHRDAGFTSKDTTTVEINGQKAAKIMIVVGANHDNWKSNLDFAQKLEDKSNAIFPGLVRSIRIVQANRYNQQAHPQALILEVGSDLNTQEEANFAMECFSQVIAEVLLAQQNG